MALLSKKEFADQTGQTTKTLSTYIGRKKVIVNKKEQIDTNNEVNKAFIATHAWRKPVKAVKTQLAVDDEEDSESINFNESLVSLSGDIPDIIVSEKRYKHALAKKTETAGELDNLKIAKLKGEVIPSAPITTIVYQLKHYWLTHAKIAFEKALIEIGHKYEIESADLSYFRGVNTKLINDAMAASSLEFTNNLQNILAEFSIKKSA